MKNLFIFRALFDALSRFCICKLFNVFYFTKTIKNRFVQKAMRCNKNHYHIAGFSLVEMLMAVLVASLLLAALAPVMTKKMNENIHITGEFSHNGKSEIKEIAYGDAEFCPEIVRDAEGNELYCEGDYIVPSGFQNITVTAIGGGGGGGTAPSAGYIEYVNENSINNFTVPVMVNELEATLVSGGAGGGVDSTAKTHTFVTYGNGNTTKDENNTITVQSTGTGQWTIPVNSRGKDMIATACGGGGGGGSTGNKEGNHYWYSGNGYGGGSGGYVSNKIINFGNASSFTYYIGGGGASGITPVYAMLIMSGGEIAKPYGGGASYGSTKTTGGGAGGDTFTGAISGEFKTSNKAGGAGGIGGPYGKQNECVCSIAPDPDKVIYLKGGDGGQPGGGGGALCHYCNCVSSGGGGGGAASQLVAGSNIILNASGGGGGGGSLRLTNLYETAKCCVAGEAGAGGGGGGEGGGAGGSVSSGAGKGGSGGKDANGYTGGMLTTNIFGANYCNGGVGGVYTGLQTGLGGKSGAIKLSYIDYDLSKGKGGAEGSVLLNRKVNVSPDEVLTVSTGKGGAGGAVAYINKIGTTGTIVDKVDATKGTATILKKGSTILLDTGNSTSEVPSGKNGGNISLFNGSVVCDGGRGGTALTPDAAAPTIGYGCGGGAGYMGGNGSKGAGGYARLVWNMNWDTALNAYKPAPAGYGGGGASGNIMKETLRVHEGQVIKIRIGAGGSGAKVANNRIIPATSGGTTIFGGEEFIQIKAGGGGGGGSPVIQNGILTKGSAGVPSKVCHSGSRDYYNNEKYCIKGSSGGVSQDAGTNGGLGAAFSYKFSDKTYAGKSGTGGILSTELNNSKGQNAEGIAAGGGGAALLIYNKISNLNELNNPSGGNGACGRIILQLWE